METTADIIKNRTRDKLQNSTVHSSSVYSSSVSPVNSIITHKEEVKFRHPQGIELKLRETLHRALEGFQEEVDYYAKHLALVLNDTASQNYYRFLVKNNDPSLLFECLALTQEAVKDGLTTYPAKFYFQGILRNKGGIASKKDISQDKKSV